MALAQRRPAELTDAVVRRLADLVGISADHQCAFFRTPPLKVGLPAGTEGLSEKEPPPLDLLNPQGYLTFGSELRSLFGSARKNHDWDVKSAVARATTKSQLDKLRKAVAVAMARLNALDDDARKALGIYAIRQHPLLDELQEALASVVTRLNALDDDARKALGIYAVRQHQFGNTEDARQRRMEIMDLVDGGWTDRGCLLVEDATKVVDGLCNWIGRGRLLVEDAAIYSWIGRGCLLVEDTAKVVDILYMAARTREWPTGPRGGRPSEVEPTNPRVTAFDLFIVALAQLVHRFGGKLPMAKNPGAGTATIEFLKLARVHLPQGLVPAGYSRRRVSQMIARGITGHKPPPK